MDIKGYVRKFVQQRLNEGFDDVGRPDLKYYAFDWDDNIMFMPTSILVMDEDENEVQMSTEDFAEYRERIGFKPFKYKGKRIVSYSIGAFKNFKEPGNKRFIIDSMIAKTGPSWPDFVECINGGSIFAIITARGHSPKTLREAVYNLIMSNKNGLDSRELAKNLHKYKDIGNKVSSDKTVKSLSPAELNEYLDMCKFEPVSYGANNAANPEQAKFDALKNFVSYCRSLASELKSKYGVDGSPMFKNDLEFNASWEPYIGFSDDDLRNIEKIKELISKEYKDSPVNLYLTKGGNKTRY